MKTINTTFIGILLLSIMGAYSCKKDSDNSNNNNNVIIPIDTAAVFVGNYKGSTSVRSSDSSTQSFADTIIVVENADSSTLTILEAARNGTSLSFRAIPIDTNNFTIPNQNVSVTGGAVVIEGVGTLVTNQLSFHFTETYGNITAEASFSGMR